LLSYKQDVGKLYLLLDQLDISGFTAVATETYVDTLISVSGGTNITDPGNNRILTSDGTAKGIQAETNMTFDGSTLAIAGNIEFSNASSRTIKIADGSGGSQRSLSIEGYTSSGLAVGGALILRAGVGTSVSGLINTYSNGFYMYDPSANKFTEIIYSSKTWTAGDISVTDQGTTIAIDWNADTVTINGSLKLNTMDSATGSTVVYYDPTTSGLTYGAGGGGGGGVSYAGGDVNNYVLTATGANTIQGESNLTFDGTTLIITGATYSLSLAYETITFSRPTSNYIRMGTAGGTLSLITNGLGLSTANALAYLGSTDVELRYGASSPATKLQTTNIGISVTGSITADDYIVAEDYVEVLDTGGAEGFKMQWNDTDKSIDFIIN